MPDTVPQTLRCPMGERTDDRKSQAAVGPGATRATRSVGDFAGARDLLRDTQARQAGFKAEVIDRFGGGKRAPILFLHGAAHRRQRAATARFFAPRVVTTRYRALIERTATRLIAQLVAAKRGDLDTLALDLAVTVAAEIVGLTDSDRDGMTRRLDAFFATAAITARRDPASQLVAFLLGQVRMWRFHLADVRPAIAARRLHPREDVISHLLAEGYGPRQILTECFTYGAAGMVTTREFVTMAGWHLLENEALRARFLDGDEAGRLAILEEILRVEPVVGTLYRRDDARPGIVAIDIRAANADERAVGGCPHAIRPDRPRADRVGGAGLAFGDGEHRCPGAGVALHEAAIFLDALLRVPGLRLERAPTVGWNPLITGYELRGCRLAVD